MSTDRTAIRNVAPLPPFFAATGTAQDDPVMDTICGERLRSVLGNYPTGVCVITASNNGSLVGMVVGSFTSISLSPPLVGFFSSKTSSTLPKIQTAGRFCVNVLTAEQADLCQIFTRHKEKVDSIPFTTTGNGTPILDGVASWLDCEITSTVEIGDHILVVGQVAILAEGQTGNPLVFCDRTFLGLKR